MATGTNVPAGTRCAARTRTGEICRRRPLPGSVFCRQHERRAPTNPDEIVRRIFRDLFSDEELAGLTCHGRAPAIDDVMPVLLVAIRRALAEGASPAVVVRACEAYVRAVRERGRQAAAGGLDEGMRRALDELSRELGIPL